MQVNWFWISQIEIRFDGRAIECFDLRPHNYMQNNMMNWNECARWNYAQTFLFNFWEQYMRVFGIYF